MWSIPPTPSRSDFYLHSLVMLILDLPMNGIKLYLLFCVWFFCFKQCFWDSLFVCVCISSIYWWVGFHTMNIPHFFLFPYQPITSLCPGFSESHRWLPRLQTSHADRPRKVVSPLAFEKSFQKFPKEHPLMFQGQNHILHVHSSRTHWQKAWDSTVVSDWLRFSLGLGRGSLP